VPSGKSEGDADQYQYNPVHGMIKRAPVTLGGRFYLIPIVAKEGFLLYRTFLLM
jgi:hypothetical protein